MKDDRVNINVDTLKDIIRSTGMPRGKIEDFILKAPNSLGNAIRRGHIKREKLETLCNFVGVQPEFVIISGEEKKPEPETKKAAAGLSDGRQDVLLDILREMKEANAKMDKLLKIWEGDNGR